VATVLRRRVSRTLKRREGCRRPRRSRTPRWAITTTKDWARPPAQPLN